MTTRTVVQSMATVLGALLVTFGVADRANVVTAARVRFVDNGDGTISDTQTRLMWEKKTGAFGAPDYVDPTNVNNTYTWSATDVGAPDGTLFTDFLARMNCTLASGNSSPGCGPGIYTDWRIPNIEELHTIRIEPCQIQNPVAPCIDPIFGVTRLFTSWSSTSRAIPYVAWGVNFSPFPSPPILNSDLKDRAFSARAVRGGL